MLIRDERSDDAPRITTVIATAFGGAYETRLVERLRRDGSIAASLVALREDTIVGHVLLSPMTGPFRAMGLAPLSVSPGSQRQGIGAALVRAAIAWASTGGWDAIFVLGDPHYYGRFGFRADLAAGFVSPYAGPQLMALPIAGTLPVNIGTIDYAPAFEGLT